MLTLLACFLQEAGQPLRLRYPGRALRPLAEGFKAGRRGRRQSQDTNTCLPAQPSKVLTPSRSVLWRGWPRRSRLLPEKAGRISGFSRRLPPQPIQPKSNPIFIALIICANRNEPYSGNVKKLQRGRLDPNETPAEAETAPSEPAPGAAGPEDFSALQLLDRMTYELAAQGIPPSGMSALRRRVVEMEELQDQARVAVEKLNEALEKLRAPALRLGTLMKSCPTAARWSAPAGRRTSATWTPPSRRPNSKQASGSCSTRPLP